MELPIINQVKLAAKSNNRLPASMGILLGGIVPLATYCLAHNEIDSSKSLFSQISTLLVLGGLFFSARTVYDWAKIAFRQPIKALGFVILMEGVMTFSSNKTLAIAALVYLVIINGIATGCNLVLDQRKVRN